MNIFRELFGSLKIKLLLLVTFIIILIIAMFVMITGIWINFLNIINEHYISIFKGYSLVVITINCFYLYVNKKKGITGLLGATILDCAAIISTFYAGINYFHEIFYIILNDILLTLSDKYLPYVMSNSVLLYWSLNQLLNKFIKIFSKKVHTEDIKESE